MHWHRENKKWQARYLDADGKTRHIGYFDDEEEAGRAVNEAIRDAGLEGKRRVNAVERRRRKNEVDPATGKLVPVKKHVAPGYGPRCQRYREKPTASYSTRARRPRRAVNFDDYLQPDDDDGWD